MNDWQGPAQAFKETWLCIEACQWQPSYLGQWQDKDIGTSARQQRSATRFAKKYPETGGAKMIYFCKIFRDGDYYSVEFPDVAGVLTYGKTLEEAQAMSRDALNLMLASIVEDGQPLPKSKPRKGTGIYAIEVNPSIMAAAEIRQARKAAGLTQKQMAARLNVAYQVYQKLEDPDRSNPTIKTLAQVARCLGHNLKVAI